VHNKVQTDVKCSNCFKSLGIPSRMEIYTYLFNSGPANVSEIVDLVNLKQPTVSYHLREMEDAGIVKGQKKGKEVYYSLTKMCKHKDVPCIFSEVDFKRYAQD